ncbi:MAG: hypothetical protein VYB61_09260 [Verrucomicrobiota bacterium]|nr:hypothetical protein [Verrucomicrobiota bacterium]
MSDEKPNPSEKPSGKTSSVPLKKETVRITLRKDAEGSAPPPPAPGAPPAPKPPAAPAAPAAPALGAKTGPLTPAPPAAAPVAGTPAAQPTAKLTPAGAPTQPGGGGTQPLPKATVKLQPAQAAGSAGAVAPITTGKLSGELDDDSAEDGVTPFAAIAMVMALAACAIGLLTNQNVFEQDKKLKEPTWAVPYRDYQHSQFEKVDRTTGEIIWTRSFNDNILPEIREYAAWKKQQL